jgi:hypothetical protein
MDVLFALGFGVLIFGSAVETLLYFFATPLLGRLAFIPMGGPPVDVGPGGQEVLSGRRAAALATEGMPREAAGYRDAPAAPLARPESVVERLGFLPKEEADSHFLYGVPARDELTLRLPFKFFGSRTYGLVHTRLRFDGHKVSVTSRFLPVPSLAYGLSSLFFLGAGLGEGLHGEALVFPGIFLVAAFINGVIAYFRLRGPYQMVRMRLEGGLYSLR